MQLLVELLINDESLMMLFYAKQAPTQINDCHLIHVPRCPCFISAKKAAMMVKTESSKNKED